MGVLDVHFAGVTGSGHYLGRADVLERSRFHHPGPAGGV